MTLQLINMTVVSAIKFNDYEGAIAADEQVSIGEEKRLFSLKLHTFYGAKNFCSVVGGAGTVTILRVVVENMKKAEAEHGGNIRTRADFAKLMGKVITQVKEGQISRLLEGLATEAELFGRYKKLPNEIKAIFKDYLEEKGDKYRDEFEDLNECFLAMSQEKRGITFDIFSLDPKYDRLVAKPFKAIGYAKAVVEDRLHEFVEQYTREDQENIPAAEAISALLYAISRAAATNRTVGGIPMLCAIKSGKIIKPEENKIKLAQEISIAERRGCLAKDFSRIALEELVFGTADYSDVNRKMWKAATEPEKLSWLLRGYKI